MKLHDINPEAMVGAALLGLVAVHTLSQKYVPTLSREEGIRYRVGYQSLKKLKEQQSWLKKEIPRLEKNVYQQTEQDRKHALKDARNKLQDVEEAIRRK